MLKRLRIKNFALIEELEVEFGEGLNVLTGSTGAGKSIMVNAIELAAGKRGSDDVIRTGKKRAVVETVYNMKNDITLNDSILEENVRSPHTITFKREYRKEGGGGAYVGSKRINLSTLKEYTENLVSIMGQHSHQKLLDPSMHIDYLDNYANIHEDLTELKNSYGQAVNLKRKLSHALRNVMEINERIELLKFQISEIERADLKDDEEESLKEEKILLENARAIMESGEAAISMLLESEDSVVSTMGETVKILRDSAAGHKEMEDTLGIINSSADSIKDAVIKIRNFIDNVNDNPQRLEDINARLHEMFRLKKKYGGGVTEILDYLKRSRKELSNLGAEDENPEVIRERLHRRLESLNNLALKISRARQTAKVRLEKLVTENLSKMGMQKAQFVIDITCREDPESVYCRDGENIHGDESGFDIVEFLFCANPGEGLKPLARIASGGEISRVMLALKNALMVKTGGGCEIFDEIDVGISGEAASRVAEQLKALSRSRQVICITHLHQIASVADHHFRVSKKKIKGRSVTTIEELKLEDRVREIASLLAGKKITEKALESARELLRNSRN